MTHSEILSSVLPAGAAREAVAEADLTTDGFFQRPFVQNFLPFLTSVSFHAGILILGLLTYTAITIVRPPREMQVNPATTDLVQSNVALPSYMGDANNPLVRTEQNQTPNVNEGASFNPSKLAGIAAMAGGGSDGGADTMSLGAHEKFGAGGGIGFSHGPGNGPGGDAGPLAAWGPKPQIGGSTNTVFRPSRARRVAYVCDASGSMINKMAALKAELEKAINALTPVQSFSIIFFQDQTRPDMFNESLVRATPQSIRQAGVFLEAVTSTGTTNPIPGLEAAFHQQPELIYLLTDGDFRDNELVLSRIRTLNKDQKVRINTIAFVGSNDTDVAFIDLLKTIARENGGNYKHVSEDELEQ